MKDYKMTKIKPVLISATSDVKTELVEILVNNFGFKIIDFDDPLLTIAYDFFGSGIVVNQTNLDTKTPNAGDLELVGRIKKIGDDISKKFWIYKFAKENGLFFDKKQKNEDQVSGQKTIQSGSSEDVQDVMAKSSEERIFETNWEPVGIQNKIEIVKRLENGLENEFLANRRRVAQVRENYLNSIVGMIKEKISGGSSPYDVRTEEILSPIFADYALKIIGVVAFDLGENGRGSVCDEIREVIKTRGLSSETVKATTMDPSLGYSLCSAIRRRLSIEEYNGRQAKEFQPTILKSVTTKEHQEFVKLNRILTISASSVQDGVDQALSSIGKKSKVGGGK
jgi:hypothetical protein